MSNSTALALITASFLPAFFCFHYITKLANDVAMEIEGDRRNKGPFSVSRSYFIRCSAKLEWRRTGNQR